MPDPKGYDVPSPLDLTSRLSDPDRVFRRLVEVHRGLGGADSADLNTRVLLILANQLGDDAVVVAAFDLARAQIDAETKTRG